MEDPQFLVNLGYWSKVPNGWNTMMDTPRYYAGRDDVLVKTNVGATSQKDKAYMDIVENSDKEKFVTFKGTLTEVSGNEFTVQQDGVSVKVPKAEVVTLNHPHIFPVDILGHLSLEDGLKCDYQSADVKIKLLQIALELAPFIPKLDFKDPNVFEVQSQCIHKIRKCLDVIIFNSGEKKDVKADRFKTGSAGKLALYGQGNCHGVSSTMASFLYPFRHMLGVDLKYRGGTSSGTASNIVEEHQWLEITFRPSMRTYVCDIWYEGIKNDPAYVCMPIKQAY